MDAFLGILLLTLLSAAIFSFLGIAKWILKPIDDAAKFHNAPIRFSIADFLCLFLAIQLPLTLVHQIQGEETEVHFWVFTILTWLIGPIVWISCARALSRAGISNGRYRLVFMGLILPVVYYGLLPFVALTYIGVASLLVDGPMQVARWWALLLLWLAIGVGLAFSGLYTHRMVRQTHGDSVVIRDARTRNWDVLRPDHLR
jgi:hypothetical protein